MYAIAQCLHDKPEVAALLAGALTTVIVQIWKRVAQLPSGEAALRKRVGAFITALLLGIVDQVATGQLDWGRLVTVVLLAWLAAAGIHSTALRRAKKPV